MKINRQPATRAVLPSAQTSSEDSGQPMNIEKANLQLQIIMMCIETHMMQVGAWETLRGLWRILWGKLEGICNRRRTTRSTTEHAPPPCVS